MAPETVVGLLAEPTRMRVFAAIVLGAATAAQVGTATGLAPREVASALRRLTDGGLVARLPAERSVPRDDLRPSGLVGTDSAGLVPLLDVFKDAMRGRSAPPSAPLDPDRTRAAVLRTFVVDGRLVSFPAAQSKRRIVLEHVVATFEPGIRYPEREVDAILRAWHDDHATLRRYLVDADLLARDKNIYWRIG